MRLKKWQIAVIICSIFIFILFAKLSIPVIRKIVHITPLELEAEDYLENKYKIKFRAKDSTPERTMFFAKTGRTSVYLVPSEFENVAISLVYDDDNSEKPKEEWIVERGTEEHTYYIDNIYHFWTYAWSEEVSELIKDDVLNYFGDCYFYALAYVNKSDTDSINSLNEFISFSEIKNKYGAQKALYLQIQTFGMSPDEKKVKDFKKEIEDKYNIGFKEIEVYYRNLKDKNYFDDFFSKGHSRFNMKYAEGFAIARGSNPVILKLTDDKIEIEE